MSNVLITMAEDTSATTESSFGLKYSVDEHDCLHFAEGLKKLGHDIFFVNWQDLQGDEFTRMFCYNNSRFVSPLKLEQMQLAFVYKMEGFYFDLPRFYAMLDRLASACRVMVNDLQTIRHNINKKYLWQLAEKGVTIIPSYELGDAAAQIAQGQAFVLKPYFGERGEGIILAKSADDLQKIAGREERYFAQKFMSEIRDGEKSLVFLGKQFMHAVIKHPSAGNPSEFRCNESLGGTVAIYQPTEKEIHFGIEVLEAYESLGYPIHFSRIDILSDKNGPVLLEAELLNPSIYANYSKIGEAFGDQIAVYFDTLMMQSFK